MPIIPESLKPNPSPPTRAQQIRPSSLSINPSPPINNEAQKQEIQSRIQELALLVKENIAKPGMSKTERRRLQAERKNLQGQISVLEEAAKQLDAGKSYQDLNQVYASAKSYGAQLKSYEFEKFSNLKQRQQNKINVPTGGYSQTTGDYSKIYDASGKLVQVIQRSDAPLPPSLQQEIASANLRYETTQPQIITPAPSKSLGQSTGKTALYYELSESGQPVDNAVFTNPSKTERVQVESRGITSLGEPERVPLYENIDTLGLVPGPQPLRVPETQQVQRIETYNQGLGLYSSPSYSDKTTATFRGPTIEEKEGIEANAGFQTFGSTLGLYQEKVVEPLAYNGLRIPFTDYQTAPLGSVWSFENAGNLVKLYGQEVVEPISESGVFNFYRENVVAPLSRGFRLYGEEVVEPISKSKAFKKYEEEIVLPTSKGLIASLKAWEKTAETISPAVSKVPIIKQVQQIAEAKKYMDRLADESPGTKVKLFIGGKYRYVDPAQYRNQGLIEFSYSLWGEQAGSAFEQVAKDIGAPDSVSTGFYVGGRVLAEGTPYLIPGFFTASYLAKAGEAQLGNGIFGGATSAIGYAKEHPLETAFVATNLYGKAVNEIRKATYGLTEAEKLKEYEKFLGREVATERAYTKTILKNSKERIPYYKSFTKEYIDPQTGEKSYEVGLKLKGYTTVERTLPTGDIFGTYSESYIPKKRPGFFGLPVYEDSLEATGDIFIDKNGNVVKLLSYSTGETKIITIKGTTQTVELFSKSGKSLVKVTQNIDDASRALLEQITNKPSKIVIDPENLNDRYIITRSKVLINGEKKEVLIIQDVINKQKFTIPSDDPSAAKFLGSKIPETSNQKIFGEFEKESKIFKSSEGNEMLVSTKEKGFSDLIVSGEKKGTLSLRRTSYGAEVPSTVQVTTKIRGTPKILYGEDKSKDIINTLFNTGEYTKVQVVNPKVSRDIGQFAQEEFLYSYINPKAENFKPIANKILQEKKAALNIANSMQADNTYRQELFQFEKDIEQLSEKTKTSLDQAAKRRANIFAFFKKKKISSEDYGIGFPSYVNGGSGYTEQLSYKPSPSPIAEGFGGLGLSKLTSQINEPLLFSSPQNFLLSTTSSTPVMISSKLVTSPINIIETSKPGLNYLYPIITLNQLKSNQKKVQANILDQKIIQEEVFQQPIDLYNPIINKQWSNSVTSQIQQPILEQNITQETNFNKKPINSTFNLRERNVNPPQETIPERRLPVIDFGFGESFTGEVTGYNAEVLTGKVWKKANPRPMTREGAIDLGARIVDNTTSAQFRIAPIKKTYRDKNKNIVTKEVKFAKEKLGRGDGYYSDNQNKFRGFKILKGQKTGLADQWIEKKTSRSDTPGEKSGLTFGQRRARASKISMGLPTRRVKSNPRQRFRL